VHALLSVVGLVLPTSLSLQVCLHKGECVYVMSIRVVLRNIKKIFIFKTFLTYPILN